MLRTFNCGVGMVLAVDAAQQQACLSRLETLGEKAWVIGEIVDREGDVAVSLA